MKVYFVSGLAADSRVFRNIRLPGHCEPVFLEWIDPVKKESLQNYAHRLAAAINYNEPFGLIGLSMGGMIVSEIALHCKPRITVLISSIPLASQLPFYLKFAGKIRLHKLVPVALVKSAALAKRLFTTETSEDKIILRNVIKDSNSAFIYWAMDAILNWKNELPPDNYIHIHGTRDEVLPIRFTKPTHIIPKAGHLMVMNRAAEINEILEQYLQSEA